MKMMKRFIGTAAMMTCVAALFFTGGDGVALAQNASARGESKTAGVCTVDGTTKAGRHVHASGDVTLGIQVEGELVIVKIGEPQFDAKGKMTVAHTLKVDKEIVVLDGKEQAKIPQSATSFQVTCAQGRLSVLAGKQSVLVTTLSR